MRKIEKVKRQVVDSRVTEVLCDLCGAKGDPTYENDDGNEWPKEAGANSDNIRETTLEMQLGWSCSDGGSSTHYRVDICPNCFTDQLIPWLTEEHGVDVHLHIEEHETDW